MNAVVKSMNTAFGNPEGDPTLLEATDNHCGSWAHSATEQSEKQWSRLEKQCKNIKAEYEELMTAIANRDLVGIRDALCDINVFSLGAHHLMGYDADADMEEVVAAVMTRFCTDVTHAADTAAHYEALGVEFYMEGTFPRVCLKSSFDQGKTIDADGGETWEYPKGKFLKALGYRQPVFTSPSVAGGVQS